MTTPAATGDKAARGIIDDDEFNTLADDALVSLSASVKTMVSDRMKKTHSPMSPEQLDYTSTLVALSVIDAYAERYTAEIDTQYDVGKIDCSDARGENEILYKNLPANLSALSGLSIP